MLERTLLRGAGLAGPVQQAVGVEGVVGAAAPVHAELEADLGAALRDGLLVLRDLLGAHAVLLRQVRHDLGAFRAHVGVELEGLEVEFGAHLALQLAPARSPASSGRWRTRGRPRRRRSRSSGFGAAGRSWRESIGQARRARGLQNALLAHQNGDIHATPPSHRRSRRPADRGHRPRAGADRTRRRAREEADHASRSRPTSRPTASSAPT